MSTLDLIALILLCMLFGTMNVVCVILGLVVAFFLWVGWLNRKKPSTQ